MTAQADFVQPARKAVEHQAGQREDQVGAALAAHWNGLKLVEGQHFALNTASVSLLRINPHHPDWRIIELWNEVPASNPRT
ncbi:MAG: hypothetical protein H7322_08010 [Ramlibacter sp.]|nr:hypothetical protein [Ramlibacter sp.]